MAAHVAMPRRQEMLGQLAAERARLVAAGTLDLHHAVDLLQELAESWGLVDELGQDAIQALIAEPFATLVEARAAA